MGRPPNILWVVTTQWRGQALGCAGDPNARTPQLDALAASGRAYVRAYTPHPFGPFARAALLTGVPSPANGVRDYFDPLPVERRTVAHMMGALGYRTGFFGKWHLAPRDRSAPLVGEEHAKIVVPPERRGGFGMWEGFESGFLLNDPWLHGTALPRPERFSGYQSDVLAARAARWCAAGDPSARADLSWFCVVSLEAPHPPYAAPAAGVPPREAGALSLPANVPRGGDVEAQARAELAGYYAHIEATDAAIGRLLKSVGSEMPIVVFTSVHGDMHGAHGLFRKGWPHEESVRVPLIVAGAPGAEVPPGGGVSLLDISAWTVAWAEGRRPAPARSPVAISMPSVVSLPRQCDRAWRGVCTLTHKLVLNEDGTPWLCFDLVEDPLEQRNLVGQPDALPVIRELQRRVVGN